MLHHATGKRQAPAFCFLLLILALVLAACGPAAAPEGDQPSLANAPEEPDAVQAAPGDVAYSITEPYRDYPDIDTLFSSYSTNEERLAACQIPEEILSNMTTEALVETIFLHPLRWTLYWNTNWTEGKVMLDWMESSFNAVLELYSRADGIAVLEGWTQEKEAQYEAEESYEQYIDLRIGQALLTEMESQAAGEPDAVQATPGDAYSITEPYRDYPDIDTLVASFSTNEERLAACQIPEEILSNMTTEALVETIFLHPLRRTNYWNTNWTEGKVMLDWMESSFNAVLELYSRADGIAVLESWTQEKEAQYEAEESYAQYVDLRIGQALLAEMQTRADWEAEHPTPAEPDAPAASTDTGAYSVTEPYVYPVPDGTEPWAGSLDLLQMVEFYRIPEEALTDRTTEALFQTVLAYPLLRSAAEDGGRGFIWLQESCAALPAFLARPDAAAVLADYQNTDEFRYGLTIKRNLVFFCLAELE